MPVFLFFLATTHYVIITINNFFDAVKIWFFFVNNMPDCTYNIFTMITIEPIVATDWQFLMRIPKTFSVCIFILILFQGLGILEI